MDQELHDDTLKLVRYKVLFVKREYEHAFGEAEELVSDRLDGAAFTAWKIGEFIQRLKAGEVAYPDKWVDEQYPTAGEAQERRLRDIPHDDKKYLRVFYEVLDRYPREPFKYEENKIDVLREIRDELTGLGGQSSDLPVSHPVGPGEVEAGTTAVAAIQMEMVSIAPGSFLMGSPATDRDANDDERPQHVVKISAGFAMSRFPVTVGQFRAFVEATGYRTEGERTGNGSTGLDLRTGLVERRSEYNWRSWLKDDPHNPSHFVQTDAHPVVCVSWSDAGAFAAWLGDLDGNTYRLPTEAEWEYACRAGSKTRFYTGDDENSIRTAGNIADASLQRYWIWKTDAPPFPKGMKLPPYAKPWDDGHPFTAPCTAGAFAPNAFGLYHMHGNVGEWCADWYDEDYYADRLEEHRVAKRRGPIADPKGPKSVRLIDISDRTPGAEPRTLRVVRGGVWLDPASGCRSADRQTHRRHPIDSAADIGFRIVMVESARPKAASILSSLIAAQFLRGSA